MPKAPRAVGPRFVWGVGVQGVGFRGVPEGPSGTLKGPLGSLERCGQAHGKQGPYRTAGYEKRFSFV